MKVSVIGCGSIGSRYTKWLADLGATVAVFDTNTACLEQFRNNSAIHIANSLDDVFNWQPQRVLVATTPNAHCPVSLAAMQAGADVLIEKPIAATLADAERILETAERLKRRAWVVCNMRFHKGIKTIRDNLPRVGKVLFARAHFGHRLSQMRPAGLNIYASNASEGGGVILDCIHEIDYLQWFFGEVVSTRAWRGQIGPDLINAEDYAELQLEFSSGVRVALHLDFLMRRKRRGFEVAGTDGNLRWDSEGRSPEFCTVSFADNRKEEILLRDPDVDPVHDYRGMLSAFLADGEGLQTATEGYRALSVALQARAQA